MRTQNVTYYCQQGGINITTSMNHTCHERLAHAMNASLCWAFCLYFTLTIVGSNLLPTPTAVSTQSKRAHWCNSHFIHYTKIEVGDGVWGCTRARHWVSGVRGGSPSPVLHRVTSDHLTRSQCWSAPSHSDLASFIQCHHWHTTISGWRYV